MTTNPYVVPGTTTIGNIRQLLRKYKIWSVFIGKPGKFEGIITKKDLETKGLTKNPSTPAYAIMSKPVYSIDHNSDVEFAIKLLKDKKINQIAVTASGKYCGVISQYDIRERYKPNDIIKTSDKSRDNSVVKKDPKKFSVFISHVNENKVVANALKALIVKSFPHDVDVFVAGDPYNISFSDDWFEKIKKGIDDCHLMIILCTPESVKRPWINFEAGAATILRKKVGPICFAGQTVGRLPSPLNYIRSQAIDCSDDESFEQYFKIFLRMIATHIGEPVPRVEILDSEFYQAIKSAKLDTTTDRNEKDLSTATHSQSNSEKELRVIKHMGQTIFSPMQGILESDRDFFRRGYNIELYFMNKMNPYPNQPGFEQTPGLLYKKIIHDPDPILQKYTDEIAELCNEYDTYSARLKNLNEDIFIKKDLIRDDFVNLCTRLNFGSFPNKQDYTTLLALIIADPTDLGNNYQMWDFFSSHRDTLHTFIMNSPLQDDVKEFASLRERFRIFSNQFLSVLTNLKTDWMKTYLFLEPDLEPDF